MVTTAREPRAYEIMAVFLPELADEDLTAQLDRASAYITSVGGTIKEVLTDSPWGRRRLAYPIRFNSQDFRDGFYAVYHFDLEPSAMVDIERELKLDTRVMRYLVVHDDPKAGERNTGRPDEEVSAGEAAVSATPAADAPVTATTMTESTDAAAALVEIPSDTAQAEPAPDDAEEGTPEGNPALAQSTQTAPTNDVAVNASPEAESDVSAEVPASQDTALDVAAPLTAPNANTASEQAPAPDGTPLSVADNSETDSEQED